MKRFMTLALAAALVMAFAATAFAGATYDRIMKDKVIRVGIMTDSIPGAFYNAKKEWVGFDVDIANEIAKRLGVKIDQVPVNNKTRIGFLQQGRIDASVSNMTHKRSRDKSIDFSITYFFDGQKMLAPKGKFSTLKDFVGKKVAVMQGTTSELNVKNLLKSLGDAAPKVISYQKESECFQALQMGRVDAWSTDSTILLGYAAQVPGKYELVGDFFSNEPYGIGLVEDDSKLRDAVNFALQDMWKDGTYEKIYNKWYGPDTKYYFPLTEKIEMWP
ncbi:transporter substrate-binding domain-containing protein [Maridesulfovibrio salexigens]|uniref:Extracellular solute-binding protein family 3 n=1 Tax=Maridesulfovibrio salexigens (strain ATCC 14822 / DSM 2638 / NCIMB 8403 / VKM B-1763) TaxID=526222 RepID=C6BS36_MARSD|nr:transporter substrate-binding domain-containing protein [Maridesulfovibrio salexigens]ACS81419.1 extracellular solute-binding protein family 3 [Maridesulfovibrio salexigens DSM 2638]